MMNVQELFQTCKGKLEVAGLENPSLEARLILINALGISREDIVLKAENDLSDEQTNTVYTVMSRRIEGEPLSKIFQEKEFWSLRFKVTKDTLDPRPDSETLIESVLDYFPDRDKAFDLLDIGTGTGCLGISVLSEYTNAKGVAIDLSPGAVEVARFNTQRHDLSDRLDIQNIGWSDLPLNHTYDLVLSNPPYIPRGEEQSLQKEVRDHDPHLALFAGQSGLEAYVEIAPIVAKILKPQTGYGVFEIGFNQAADVSDIFRKNGLDVLEVRQDLGGRDRCVIVKTA